ncbi:GGDEF domain-containing protein [Pseudomonas sp. D2-3]
MSAKGKKTVSRRAYKPQSQPFWLIFKRCVQIGGCTNILLFLLFHWLGSPILAWVSVVSFVLYVLAYQLLLKRHNKVAVAVVWFEVLAHASLGVVMLGWESGTHVFILLFVPITVASTQLRHALLPVAALWIYYVGLYLLTQLWLPPLQPVSVTATIAIHTVSLGIVIAMLGYLAHLYLSTIHSAQQRLRDLAITDPLTGLSNRRFILEAAHNEAARTVSDTDSLSFVLADLDHFKSINDIHGHEAGDRVLVAVSEVFRSCVRGNDLVARWGGEEFLLMLTDTPARDARNIAERIRQNIESLDIPLGDTSLGVTLTMGLSVHCRGETVGESISRADQALYRGKQAGRNRVEIDT